MKLTYILVALCIIAVANTVSAQDDDDNDNLDDLLKEAPAVDTKAVNNAVTFHLYTNQNPNSDQRITRNRNSVSSSNFNGPDRNVIIIHDWNSNYQDRLNTGLTFAFLRKNNFNIICVDWRAAAFRYPNALNNVDSVAKDVANMIDFLNTEFGPLGFLQLFGHGLGAHIAGSVGHQLASGRLGKITGIDPSRPGINFNSINKHLSPDDAVYVETIQTNGGEWGWDRPLGTVTFYPNGGRIQPSCGGQNVNWCSHWRAVDYVVEAVTLNNYRSKSCATPQDAHLATCNATFSNVRLAGPSNYSRGIKGVYYVPVNARSPYGTAVNP